VGATEVAPTVPPATIGQHLQEIRIR